MGEIPFFWKNMQAGHCPFYDDISHLIDSDRTCALGMHGDGAPTTKVEGLFTIAWNSLHAKPSSATKDSRFVFTVVKKSDVSNGVLKAVWDRLAWAMNALTESKFPDRV
jgi:hypothetical protein